MTGAQLNQIICNIHDNMRKNHAAAEALTTMLEDSDEAMKAVCHFTHGCQAEVPEPHDRVMAALVLGILIGQSMGGPSNAN